MDSKYIGQPLHIPQEKIIIFEDSQHSYVGCEAHEQECFSPRALCFIDQYPCEIIDDNSEYENQDVNRDKKHIENATGDE